MTAPECPICGGEMVRRTARKGPNAGNDFYGCSSYPSCRGTLSLESEGDPDSLGGDRGAPATRALAAFEPRVEWHDGSIDRQGWLARYTFGGASLRSVEVPDAVKRRVATCWIAAQDTDSIDFAAENANVRRVVALVAKIFQRGEAPPLDPRAEVMLLERSGLGDRITASGLPKDIGPRLTEPVEVPPEIAAQSWGEVLEPTESGPWPFDSREEREWYEHWAASVLGPEWMPWITPQAPLDLLLEARGVPSAGARRVDFLVAPPWMAPFVVEIDGSGHDIAGDVDAERDTSLREVGIEVFRVPTAELERPGPGLAAIAAHCDVDFLVADPSETRLLRNAVEIQRLALGLLEGVLRGFLAGDQWTVDVASWTPLAVECCGPYLDLFSAAARLWGEPAMAPRRVVFTGVRAAAYVLGDDGRYTMGVDDGQGSNKTDLRLYLEADRGPGHSLPPVDMKVPAVVVRSAAPPVRIRDLQHDARERATVSASVEETRDALTFMLQHVFAKEEFREGQVEAILEVLAGGDSVALLPTGAGKSIIYQLAGLCMPGRTLVVDPLVALIEDQVHGLRGHGIDRVAWITGDSVQRFGSDAVLDNVRNADALFMLVSPERLQIEGFRQALKRLSATTVINLAVVDEAHCVSEWGHDFRTSYLNLGGTIARTCASPSGARPPIMALTGTASRAVLRDVLYQLNINERQGTIVRPRNFDREELRFAVEHARPSDSEAALEGALAALPSAFGTTGANFYRERGERTQSGLVFCQVVNGRRGVADIADTVGRMTRARVGMYSGQAPKKFGGTAWADRKAASAAGFKDNSLPILVSTNAFGMGIDKPNIRWVIHYGLPKSIEAYYQEVGRAGRDKGRAQCVLICSEFDENRNRSLLSDDVSLEEARARCEAITTWAERDDVTTALFFHFSSFPGIAPEVDHLNDVVALLDPAEERRVRELPFQDGGTDVGQQRERAIHRLMLLGVVEDYTKEWGSKKFTVTTGPASVESVRAALLAFVERSQPGRLDAIRAQVERTPMAKLRDAIDECGRILIEFVYDTVERSRRRSMREMWLAAKEYTDDASIRTRILAYLSEGDIVPKLEALAERSAFSWPDWRELLEGVRAAGDAGEWRGAAGRLLASYPDHPGLLVARALAELVDPEGDLEEYRADLTTLEDTAARYGLTQRVVIEINRWLVGRASGLDSARAAAALAVAAEWLGDDEFADVLAGLPSEVQNEPAVAVLVLHKALRAEYEELSAIDEILIERYT